MFDQNGEEMVLLINTVISWVSTVFPGGQPLRRPIETSGLSTSGFAVESGQVGTSRETGNVSAPYPGPDSSQGARRCADRCACVSCCRELSWRPAGKRERAAADTEHLLWALSCEPLPRPPGGGRSSVCCMCVRLSALE